MPDIAGYAPLPSSIITRSVAHPGRPWVRTTFQLAAEIPTSKGGVDQAMQRGIEIVLRWLQQKFPKQFPGESWQGNSFHIELPGQKIECLMIEETGLWSLRLEQPDMPFRGRPAVPGRVWTADLSLVKRSHSIGFGIRVFCASLPYSQEEVILTRPRVVTDLAQQVGLEQVYPLNGQPWTIENEVDLQAFYDLLVDQHRTLPVVVLTQPDRRRLEVNVSDYVLDPERLAWQTQGIAYVVKLPWQLSFQWTELVGKPWSVYLGSVRTYMPGLDFDSDSPVMHPRSSVEQIIFWRHLDVLGEKAFSTFLRERLLQYTAAKRVAWGDLQFIAEARVKQAELRRQKTQDVGEWRQLYEEEIASLHERITDFEKEIDEYVGWATEAEHVRETCAEENRRLRAQNDGLRARLTEKTGENPDSSIPILDAYDNLSDWVEQYLVGRLVLHPRALRGLKEARYEDVELVYRALLLLAHEYRDMRMGVDGGKQAFDEGLTQLELRCSESISEERAGEEGDTYFVRYPVATSPRQFLKHHLRKGSIKDDRYCLAVYFFWDDSTRQVVVGWLPSHLDNRMS